MTIQIFEVCAFHPLIKIICFEYIHLEQRKKSIVFNRLFGMGYKWIHDSMNTLAIKNY